MRAAAGADPPMSAWLPITRASVTCVTSVSLSARRSELPVEYRKLYLELRFNGVWMPDRRAEPAVVHGFPRGLLVLDDASLNTTFVPSSFGFAGHPGPSRVAQELAHRELKFLGAVGHNNVFQLP